MDTLQAFTIIVVTGLIHASFQLSLSVATLLGGHAIGKGSSHARVVRTLGSFVAGVGVMTTLLVSTSALVFISIFHSHTIPTIVWAAVCGLLFGLGAAVWIFYYRRTGGTTLWLPRNMARYLTDRTKATKEAAEAFGLGISSVLAELLFIIVPIVVASLTLLQLSPGLQLAGVATYAVVSLLSLLLVVAMVGSGHKISRIQKWRESNKHFLQFVSGAGLLALGFYLYAIEVATTAASGFGGGY